MVSRSGRRSDVRTDGRSVDRAVGRIVNQAHCPSDGRSVGWMDGWSVGRIDGWTFGRSDLSVDRTVGRIVNRADGRSDERAGGRADGRLVGRTDGRSDGHSVLRLLPALVFFSFFLGRLTRLSGDLEGLGDRLGACRGSCGCLTFIGCLQYTKFCWVGKHANIVMKPSNSPTQGQPNPRKIRLKVASGPLFPTANIFRGLGLVLYRKQTTINPTQPNSAQTPY